MRSNTSDRTRRESVIPYTCWHRPNEIVTSNVEIGGPVYQPYQKAFDSLWRHKPTNHDLRAEATQAGPMRAGEATQTGDESWPAGRSLHEQNLRAEAYMYSIFYGRTSTNHALRADTYTKRTCGPKPTKAGCVKNIGFGCAIPKRGTLRAEMKVASLHSEPKLSSRPIFHTGR